MTDAQLGYMLGHLTGWVLIPVALFCLALVLPPARWLWQILIFGLTALIAACLQDIGGDARHD